MCKKIVPPSAVITLIQILESFGFEAYAVGGCVRDSLLGIPPQDWDLCTSALPEQMLAIFSKQGCFVKTTGLQHGTITVTYQHQSYEITTFRTEKVYTDHRHPDEVSFSKTLQNDLKRRDFTINAMAYHPKKGIIDLFHGQLDIQKKRLQCVGNPNARLSEDALRILRALRFCAVYGFSPAKTTSIALHKNKNLLRHITPERVYNEVSQMLCGQGILPVLLSFWDVLAVIVPEILPCVNFDQHSPYHQYNVWEHTAYAVSFAKPEVIVRFALLLHDLGKPDMFSIGSDKIGHFYGHAKYGKQLSIQILKRLRASNNMLKVIPWLVLHHDDSVVFTQQQIQRRLNKWGLQLLTQWIEVKKADAKAHTLSACQNHMQGIEQMELVIQNVISENQCFSLKQLAVNGTDLLGIGLVQSAVIGQVLNVLLEKVISRQLPNEKQALLNYAANL